MTPKQHLKPEDVTVVILAGGRGRRMEGQDKGLIEFSGRPLVQRVAEAMQRQSNRIMVNANRNQQVYRDLGFAVISDQLDGFQGPLAGMLSAMKAVETRFILTLPCDGPFVEPDYLERMVAARNATGSELVVASDGERLQPVYALLDTALADSLEQYLQDGERKIDVWYRMHSFVVEAFDPTSDFFTNLNTADDVRALNQEMFEGSSS